MKKPQQQIVKLLAISFLWVSVVPAARADSVQLLLMQIRDATQATAKYVNTILTNLQSTGKQVLDALTVATPEIDNVTKANTQIGSGISKQQSEYELPLTQTAIRDILTNTTDNLQTAPQTKLLSLPGPDFPPYKNYKIGPNLSVSSPANSSQGPSPFSLDTLIGKIAFPDGSAQGNNDCQSAPGQASANKPLCQSYAAQGFIGYVSGLSNPPIVPSFNTLKTKGIGEAPVEEFRNSVKVQNYLAELRSYTSAQSVGLNNFYHLYAGRVIQTGLGKTLNVHKFGTVDAKGKIIPGEVIADVSPLQAEEYLAKRRVYDPAWYKNMESATSPLTLARETLYVLAEIRLELFRIRMENERLLSTMSAMELQSLKSQKALLDQQASTIELPKPPSPPPPPSQNQNNTQEQQQQQSLTTPEQQSQIAALQQKYGTGTG